MLRTRVRFAAFGLLGLTLVGCGQGKDPVLAKVGKEVITASEFRTSYLTIKPQDRPPLATLEDKKKFLDDLISKRVMEYLAFAKYPELTDRQQVRLRRYREKELADLVRKRLVRDAVAVTPAMKDWLYAHMNEERNLRAMLIPDPDAAQWVRKQLDAGAPFAPLARDHSAQWVSRSMGGEVGWKQPDFLPYPVAVEVWSAQVGARIGPIRRGLGSYIVEVLGTRPAQTPVNQSREAMDRVLEEKLLEPLYLDRQKAVQDSLRAAAAPYYPAAGKALLNMKYYMEPPADAALNPMWKLDVDRVTPTFSIQEDTVIAVDFKNAPDWTVKEFAERLSWYPSGMWPFGESEEQLVEAMDLVVRDWLFLKAGQDLGFEDAAFAQKIESQKRQMRVTYYYYNDIVAKFAPDQAHIDAYFQAHRDQYQAPQSYKLSFFGSKGHKALVEKLAADWKKGASFSELRAKYEKQDHDLLAVGETDWLYTGQDQVRDDMVATLKEGGITEPTIRNDVSMVFKLIARREPRLMTYGEIKDQVDEDAKTAITDEKLSTMLQDERGKLGVTIKTAPLEKLDIPRDAPAPEPGQESAAMRDLLKLGQAPTAKKGPGGP
jgi:parvulin-like peptidyl-prolyl cis-trans isomerase-like protein